MPTVHRIGSTKIDVYFNDHLPPHFHVICGNDRALVEIRTLAIYSGYVPPKSLKAVLDWAAGDGIQEKLMDFFIKCNPRHSQET